MKGLKVLTKEEGKEVEKILNPFRCEVSFDKVRIDDSVPFDKLSEVVDYMRHKQRVARNMETYPMSVCLWKDSANGFTLELTACYDEVENRKIDLKFGSERAFREFVVNLQKQVAYLLNELDKDEE